jgi:hypothetical protein
MKPEFTGNASDQRSIAWSLLGTVQPHSLCRSIVAIDDTPTRGIFPLKNESRIC